jgi:eukaryotic-like serine/threonine-protein kinase
VRPQLARSYANLARLRLRQQRVPEARTAARQAMAILEELGQVEDGEMTIRLQEARTAHASGETARAREILGGALEKLRDRAARIQDPAVRESFLRRVPENAELLALEQAWNVP